MRAPACQGAHILLGDDVGAFDPGQVGRELVEDVWLRAGLKAQWVDAECSSYPLHFWAEAGLGELQGKVKRPPQQDKHRCVETANLLAASQREDWVVNEHVDAH